MSNYLTKEEIKQWRSSLEKITLEEFAARLGKEVEESKSTNDVVDIIMTKGTSVNSKTKIKDGFSAIAERAFKRELAISHTPFSINKKELKSKEELVLPNSYKEQQQKESINEDIIEDIDIKLNKSLTDREQIVFDYFVKNYNKAVYAKDIAALLDLPRDYVYKYIKNLRTKIEGDRLKNVPSGGFILS